MMNMNITHSHRFLLKDEVEGMPALPNGHFRGSRTVTHIPSTIWSNISPHILNVSTSFRLLFIPIPDSSISFL